MDCVLPHRTEIAGELAADWADVAEGAEDAESDHVQAQPDPTPLDAMSPQQLQGALLAPVTGQLDAGWTGFRQYADRASSGQERRRYRSTCGNSGAAPRRRQLTPDERAGVNSVRCDSNLNHLARIPSSGALRGLGIGMSCS